MNKKVISLMAAALISTGAASMANATEIHTNKQVKNQYESGSATAAASSTYTVRSGDTLFSIASRYKLTAASLKQLNGLTSNTIYVGQKLKVSGQTAASPATYHSYTVKKGETLKFISSKYGMTVTALKQLNKLTSDTIFVGQKLKVAAGSTVDMSDEKLTFASSENVVSIAKSFLGVPYVWGGSSPSGFDCSGFISYIYKQAGENISRTTTDGFYKRSFEVSSPKEGDLVFFRNTYKPGISHMGIYLSGDRFIHASSSSGITITSLDNPYFSARFDSFKRLY